MARLQGAVLPSRAVTPLRLAMILIFLCTLSGCALYLAGGSLRMVYWGGERPLARTSTPEMQSARINKHVSPLLDHLPRCWVPPSCRQPPARSSHRSVRPPAAHGVRARSAAPGQASERCARCLSFVTRTVAEQRLHSRQACTQPTLFSTALFSTALLFTNRFSTCCACVHCRRCQGATGCRRSRAARGRRAAQCGRCRRQSAAAGRGCAAKAGAHAASAGRA